MLTKKVIFVTVGSQICFNRFTTDPRTRPNLADREVINITSVPGRRPPAGRTKIEDGNLSDFGALYTFRWRLNATDFGPRFSDRSAIPS